MKKIFERLFKLIAWLFVAGAIALTFVGFAKAENLQLDGVYECNLNGKIQDIVIMTDTWTQQSSWGFLAINLNSPFYGYGQGNFYNNVYSGKTSTGQAFYLTLSGQTLKGAIDLIQNGKGVHLIATCY